MLNQGEGSPYVAGAANNVICRAPPGPGNVETLAGTGAAGGLDGPAATATFNNPQGLAIDRLGYSWVADSGTNTAGSISRPEPCLAEVFRQAFQAWSGVSTARVSFTEGKATGLSNAAQDGVNLISLVPADYNSSAPSLTILYTVSNPAPGQFPG